MLSARLSGEKRDAMAGTGGGTDAAATTARE
jgi:hypothetical protein